MHCKYMRGKYHEKQYRFQTRKEKLVPTKVGLMKKSFNCLFKQEKKRNIILKQEKKKLVPTKFAYFQCAVNLKKI